jgi:hypothetical protein
MQTKRHLLSGTSLEHHFTPISLDNYLTLYLYLNPLTNPEDLKTRLAIALTAKHNQQSCACGAEIWVVGSAEAGLACFTCITAEAYPDDDYEIDLLL